jgi:hypothetical protein
MTLSDSKGDTLNYPKVVMQLPFTEQGSTSGTEQYADDYSVACGAADADPGSAPVSAVLKRVHVLKRGQLCLLSFRAFPGCTSR